MALTLLDVAKRTGSDTSVGLVEEVTTYAPELMTLPVRPISGTTFKTSRRTGLPDAGFRAANAGRAIQASTYEQILAQAFFLDTPLSVDEAVVKADPGDIGDILAAEAAGAMEGAGIAIGSQFYYGVSADASGFAGLYANYDSTNIEVTAAGTGGAYTSVYFVWENVKGVHLVAGNNEAIDLGSPNWIRQKVLDSDSKSYFAYCNNVCGYIGLAFGHTKSVCRVKLITSAKPFTDALAAQALSKFPVSIRNSGELRCFMNRDAAYYLQNSRSSVGTTKADRMGGSYAPTPTEVLGVPITITDSITSTETA